MQRKFRVLTLNARGWKRKCREPESTKLPTSENFTDKIGKIMAITQWYEWKKLQV